MGHRPTNYLGKKKKPKKNPSTHFEICSFLEPIFDMIIRYVVQLKNYEIIIGM